ALGAIKHGDRVPRLVQLRGGCKASRARTNDGDLLPRAAAWWPRNDPTFAIRAVDDADLGQFDGDGLGVDAQHAGSLAGSGADASGEFREVVRLVQRLDGFAPTATIDEVIPFRDQIPQRTPLVAEGNAAVHAAAGLL